MDAMMKQMMQQQQGGMKGNGGGGGSAPAGSEAAMAKLLPYLPKIMSFATEAPAFLVGYVLAFLFFVVVSGVTHFRETISPVAGFHLVSLSIVAVLWGCLQQGLVARSEATRKRQAANAVADDLALLRHEAVLD